MWALSLVHRSCTRHVLCPCDPSEPAVSRSDTGSGSAAGRKGTLQSLPRHAELAPSSKHQAWAGIPEEEVSSLSRVSEPSSPTQLAQGSLSTHHWVAILCTRCSQLGAEGAELTLAWEGPRRWECLQEGQGKVNALLTEDLLEASLLLSCWSPSHQTESVLSFLRERKRRQGPQTKQGE